MRTHTQIELPPTRLQTTSHKSTHLAQKFTLGYGISSQADGRQRPVQSHIIAAVRNALRPMYASLVPPQETLCFCTATEE